MQKKNYGYTVIFSVHSMADTLDGINAAIENETGDKIPWFEDEKSLTDAVREGFISLHTDGFITWADER